MKIDIERLREDLIDYYGVAAFSGISVAMMDVFEVEDASEEELIKLAEEAGWDLTEYEEDEYER